MDYFKNAALLRRCSEFLTEIVRENDQTYVKRVFHISNLSFDGNYAWVLPTLPDQS